MIGIDGKAFEAHELIIEINVKEYNQNWTFSRLMRIFALELIMAQHFTEFRRIYGISSTNNHSSFVTQYYKCKTTKTSKQ